MAPSFGPKTPDRAGPSLDPQGCSWKHDPEGTLPPLPSFPCITSTPDSDPASDPCQLGAPEHGQQPRTPGPANSISVRVGIGIGIGPVSTRLREMPPSEAALKSLAARRKSSRLPPPQVPTRAPGQPLPRPLQGHDDTAPRQVQASTDHGAIEPEPGSIDSLDSLPPRAIGLGLLDIYFERLYNAHLLFRKPPLFAAYLDGRLPPYLLKAIFAVATM
ncbi:hypothetical protein Micbo1qcDRAFT_210150 [Microdochium bolleyi]|uniref:Uncharacterized protein n=1 Tax=Microdochium bolleyi TaxID=196109 RepID=A0A136IKV3_9PEZI|nr:hypothetical protein Micbo1qcDRAFT_210150 [Microdochium bolleyi]